MVMVKVLKSRMASKIKFFELFCTKMGSALNILYNCSINGNGILFGAYINFYMLTIIYYANLPSKMANK